MRPLKNHVRGEYITICSTEVELNSGNLRDDCLICNSKEKIEMHHVKIRKEGDNISGFWQIMSNLNRKQIPVCHACHMKIHSGKYDKSLSELRKNIQ